MRRTWLPYLVLSLWRCSSGGGLCRGATCAGPTLTPDTLTVPSGTSHSAITISSAAPVSSTQPWAAVTGTGANAVLTLTSPPCGATDLALTVGSRIVTVHVLVEDAITSLIARPASVTVLPGGHAEVQVAKVSGACPQKKALIATSSTAALGISVVDADTTASVTVSAPASASAPAGQEVTLSCGAIGLTVPVSIVNRIDGVLAEGGIDWTVSVDGTSHSAGVRADGRFTVFVDQAPYALTFKNSAAPRTYRYKALSVAAPLLPASLALTPEANDGRVHVTLAPAANAVASFAAVGSHGDWFTSDGATWSGSDGAPSVSNGPDARWSLGAPQISGWLDVLQTSAGFSFARIPLSLLNGAAISASASFAAVGSQNVAFSAILPAGYVMNARTIFAVVDAGAGLPVSIDPAPTSVAVPGNARMAVSASATAASGDLLVFVADADPTQPVSLTFPLPVAGVSTASGNASTTLSWSGPVNAAYAVDVVSADKTVVCSAWSVSTQLALADCALAPGTYTLHVAAIGPAGALDELTFGIADPARFGKRVPLSSNFFAIAPPVALTVTP